MTASPWRKGWSWQRVWSWAMAALLLMGAAAGAQAQAQEEAEAGDSQAADQAADQIVLDILDEDALLIMSRVDGRDVVRVLGRNVVRHRERVVWSDELEYDQADGRAVMTGDVELVDEGDDPLQLSAAYLELDLDNETAMARGQVRFTQDEVRGTAEVFHYGEYSRLRSVIEAEFSARRAGAAAIEAALADFLPDDRVLVLIDGVELQDGDREFITDFVVVNTRSDALLSVGRSAARLPGPDED